MAVPVPTSISAVRRDLGSRLFAMVAGPEGPTNRERIHGTPGARWFDEDRPIRRVNADASMFVGGLRALLQQRLWIRDRSPHASQQELDEAAASMRSTRERLQPLLKGLTQAQTDLNSAMRDHIQRESDT